jgi:hypothetical protein
VESILAQPRHANPATGVNRVGAGRRPAPQDGKMTTPEDFTEIVADIDYRIEQIWLKIRREAAMQQAKAAPGDARASAAEFAHIRDTAVAIVEHVWSYVLDICRSREIRPSDLVPRATQSLTYLCRALVDYGRDRTQAGDDAAAIKAAARSAANAVHKHIQVTAREAELGYAGGKPVFPRAQWPDTWFQASTRKALAGGIFILGAVTGSVLLNAMRAIWP